MLRDRPVVTVKNVIFRMHQHFLQIMKTDDPVGRKTAQPIKCLLYKQEGLGIMSRALVKAMLVYKPVVREARSGEGRGQGEGRGESPGNGSLRGVARARREPRGVASWRHEARGERRGPS